MLRGIESRGHTGFAERGSDVVCAAVSSLLHALLLGLSDVAKVEGLECEVDPEGPFIRIMWPKKRAGGLSLLTRTIALSLREIESGNPGYVNITEVQL
ncbi:MAG: ribosomal-processing cysteine protease Prp [Synergistaceae bacterium]|nr:ribosomal-processing cysteine protease Prp [Synergistaceae bacterium]